MFSFIPFLVVVIFIRINENVIDMLRSGFMPFFLGLGFCAVLARSQFQVEVIYTHSKTNLVANSLSTHERDLLFPFNCRGFQISCLGKTRDSGKFHSIDSVHTAVCREKGVRWNEIDNGGTLKMIMRLIYFEIDVFQLGRWLTSALSPKSQQRHLRRYKSEWVKRWQLIRTPTPVERELKINAKSSSHLIMKFMSLTPFTRFGGGKCVRSIFKFVVLTPPHVVLNRLTQ